jgi:phosphopantothenoylcysteine decarboxylase
MNVLLGATGSVAAIRVPELVGMLQAAGHGVRIVATDAATYFFDPQPLRFLLTLDADEWPGERYQRGDAVRHIDLRKWADVFVLAPLDANTLAKLAAGICDNALTCVWRAWDLSKPVVLAPAMNTLMWRHPFTRRHLRAIAADFGVTGISDSLDEDAIIPIINQRGTKLKIAAPIAKTLACGDDGMGAMADLPNILGLIGG